MLKRCVSVAIALIMLLGTFTFVSAAEITDGFWSFYVRNNNAIADALGWQINTLTKVKIDRFAPQLATGTNEIPNEGLYHLHQGEAVVPKKYNPALGNGGSDEMVAKMDMLIDIMNNMNFTNIVNVGNKKLYEGQQAFNKTQQNKYGTINLY